MYVRYNLQSILYSAENYNSYMEKSISNEKYLVVFIIFIIIDVFVFIRHVKNCIIK